MHNIQSALSVVALVGAIAGAAMWTAQTSRHRSHLNQCIQDLQRHRRLDRRLTGCVNELERTLDSLPPTTGDQIPEELVGHVRYLFGLRQEAGDNASHLARHSHRLRWPDGYLTRPTLAGRRCELAHGALVVAFTSLADAVREYERGLAAALRRSGDGEHTPSTLVRLLDEQSGPEIVHLREQCGSAAASAADATNLRFVSRAAFESHWPTYRAELVRDGVDPYDGEIRPFGWQGLGPEPLVPVDAQ